MNHVLGELASYPPDYAEADCVHLILLTGLCIGTWFQRILSSRLIRASDPLAGAAKGVSGTPRFAVCVGERYHGRHLATDLVRH